MKVHRRRSVRSVAVALAVGLVATAVLATAAGAQSPARVASAATPSEITIGYQQVPNGDLVVKHEGWLEKAFGKNVTINWKQFDSGGLVNQAVLGGGIDIGLVGSSPVSRGLSTGIEYQVPWIFDVIGDAEALAVKSDIKSLKDLKGKTIATPFASTSHYSLLAALQEAGLSTSDVKVIDAEPDAIYAAWQQGDIDGAYVWNPNLAKLVENGGHTLITSADLAKKGKTTYDLAVVSNDFAKKYPGAVKTWLTQENRAVELLHSNPTKAAKDIAAELNITPAEAKQQASQLIFVDAADQAGKQYLGGGLADNLYASALFNKDLGQIQTTESKADYQKAVVPAYAKAVAKSSGS
jgi:taurine transport system substrate-binding protein